MNQRAAIQAQLVDVRNVGMHKSVKLTLHVPAEQAELVMKIFGWPTQVAPVAVALARIADPSSSGNEAKPEGKSREYSLAQRVGMLCGNTLFWRYLEQVKQIKNVDETIAAAWVRQVCDVSSRLMIIPGSQAAVNYDEKILAPFRRWKHEPEFTP